MSKRATSWRGERDFWLEVAKGQVNGHDPLNKWGGNPDVGIAAFEDLWIFGGLYNWLTAASAVRIRAGGNAADDAAGTGAREITVIGLDENWAEVNETIATAGASASSATTTTFFRVFRAFVSEVGAYGNTNAGDVIIETTGGTAVADIGAGYGQTRLALFTVPVGRTLYVNTFRVSVDSSKAATVRFRIRLNAHNTADTFGAFSVISEWAGLTGTEVLTAGIPYVFPQYTDIVVSAKADGGAPTSVYAEFDGMLVDNG